MGKSHKIHQIPYAYVSYLPAEANDFIVCKTSRLALRSLSLLFCVHQVSFSGVKQPENVVEHLPPSRTTVTNEHCYTSAPPPPEQLNLFIHPI